MSGSSELQNQMPPYVGNYFQPGDYGYFTEENWGSGKSTLDYPEIAKFPYQLELFVLGHFAACPTIANVGYDYMCEMPWILRRYDSCNWGMRRLLLPLTKELNPTLHKQISTPIDREPNEPVGVLDKGFVPPIHVKVITPMGTPLGYGGAREVYLMTRGNIKLDEIGKSREYKKALEKCVGDSGTPAALLVGLALAAIDVSDADKYSALDHAVAGGKVKEENNLRAYAAVVGEFVLRVPWVISFVNHLPESDHDKAKFKDLFYRLLKLV